MDFLHKKDEITDRTALSLMNGTRRTSYGSTSRQDCIQSTTIIEHEILSTDTLQGIALHYGVAIETIRRANKMWIGDVPIIGSVLRIPISKSDQYCNDIAERTGTDNCKTDHQKQIGKDSDNNNWSNIELDGIDSLLSKIDKQLETCKKFNIRMERNLNDSIRRFDDSNNNELPWKPLKKMNSSIQVQVEAEVCSDSDDELQQNIPDTQIREMYTPPLYAVDGSKAPSTSNDTVSTGLNAV